MFSKNCLMFSACETLHLWDKFKVIIKDFNGDAEKFYTEFYGRLIDNLLPSKFEDIALTNILLTEVANHLLIHLNGGGSDILTLQSPPSKSDYVLVDRELKSLQYLGGYIVHKLYTKFKFSPNNKSVHNKLAVVILQACKVDCDDSQTYVNTRDRGGLWKVNKKTQVIFVECEKKFRAI